MSPWWINFLELFILYGTYVICYTLNMLPLSDLIKNEVQKIVTALQDIWIFYCDIDQKLSKSKDLFALSEVIITFVALTQKNLKKSISQWSFITMTNIFYNVSLKLTTK